MTRRHAALALVALLVPALVAGCSGTGARGKGAPRALRTAADSLADWRARADSLDAALGLLPKVVGLVPGGGVSATFTAWFDGGEVRAIREEVSLGDQGSRTNRFYFERGVPRFALESGMVLAGSKDAPALRKLERETLFDDSGALAAGSKSLDGVPSMVAGYEAGAVLGHAQQLRMAARTARAAETRPGPPGTGKPAQ